MRTSRLALPALCLVLAITAAGAAHAARSDPALRVQKLREVQALEMQGRFDQAVAILKQLLEDDPNDSLVMRRLAGLYQKAGRTGDQIPMLERLIAARPQDLDLYRWLGDTYQEAGRGDEARATWWEIPQVFHGRLPYYLLTANLFSKYGYFDDAVAVLRQARLDSGQPEIYADELCRIHLQTMDYLDYCREIVGLLKRNSEHYREVRDQMIKVGGERAVLSELVEAMDVLLGEDDGNGWVLRLKGDLLLAAGWPDEALPVYRKAAVALGGPACLVEFGFRLIEMDRLEIARQALAAALELAEPGLERDMAVYSLGAVERRLGDPERARELLAGLLAGTPEEWLRRSAELELGRILLFNRSEPAEALSYYESYLAEIDELSLGGEASFELVRLYAGLDRRAAAANLLGRIAESRTSSDIKERAELELTDLQFFNGDFGEASAGYRRFVRRHPGSAYANDALQHLRALQKGLKGDTTALKTVAGAEYRRYVFQPDSACALLEYSIEGDAAGDLLGAMVLTLSDIYVEQERPESARDLLEWFVAEKSDDHLAPEAVFRLADIYEDRLHDRSRARKLLEELILKRPGSPHAARARAELELLSDIMP